MKYLLQLLILSSCHMIHGVLEWIVVEKVTDYGQNVTLFCNVSNCCPKLAGWDRWTPVQRTLYIDVKTGRPTKKYDGKALKDGYTLVIKNLTKQDLNVSYSCLYDVTLGERKFLLEEDVFINTSSTQPTGPFVDIRIAVGKIVGISLGVVAVTVAFFIFFVWKQRAKRSKHIRNSIEVPEEAVPLIDYFLEDPCNIECIEGQEAIFTCKVGPNSPFVKWFKDGNAIKQSDNCIISIVDKQHKLKIQNTKPSDRGEYCVVVGEFSRKVQLNIKDIQKEISVDERNTYIDAINSGTELRQYVRIQVIGKDRVGKTSLIRRLLYLDKGRYGGQSTDGIDIYRKCQIRTCDGEWIVGEVDSKMKMTKRILQATNRKQQENEPVSDLSLQVPSEEKQHETENKQNEQELNQPKGQKSVHKTIHEHDEVPKLNDETKYTNNTSFSSRNHSYEKELSRVHVVGNMEKSKEMAYSVDLSSEAQTSFSEINDEIIETFIEKVDDIILDAKAEKEKMTSDGLIECGIWDFAGQKDYYATHQTFFTPHAIYLLVADIKADIKADEEFDFNSIGDYIDFWFDSIHCFCKDMSAVELCPAIIMVCTGTDKVEQDVNWEREYNEKFFNTFGGLKKADHRRGIYFISNTNFLEEDNTVIIKLRKHISDIAKHMNYFAENLPTKWIQLENVLEVLKEVNEHRESFLSFGNMAKIANKISIGEKELLRFLSYQHKIGNIIFFKEMREYIILHPEWLVKCFRCLVCDDSAGKRNFKNICNTAWTRLKSTGALSNLLINQLFEKEPKLKFRDHQAHVLNVMEKFDIVIKPRFRDTSQISDSFYLPCMIEKSASYESIKNEFIGNDSGVKISPWLVLEFEFLPLAYFNHILFHYIRNYNVCRVEKERLEHPAIYRGKAVFFLDNRRQFIICFSHNATSLQIWEWEDVNEDIYRNVLDKLCDNIEYIKGQLNQNISYTIKAKCSTGDYSKISGRISFQDLTEKEDYKCAEHKCLHAKYDIENTWLKYAAVRVGGTKFYEKFAVRRQFPSKISRQVSKAIDWKYLNQQIKENVLQDEDKRNSERYSCSCLDLHYLEIRNWKKRTDNFNFKGVIEDMQKELEDSSCVTLVGTENEEVNAILQHIALSFVRHNDCYTIIPCKSPVEVVNHFKLDKHQLFVLEDACGRLFPEEETVQYLIEHDRNFKQMLQAGKTKIMISFTACVYWKTISSKTDLFFRKHIKHLAPEYSDQFAPQQSVSTVKFETAWRDQLDNWFLNDKPKHCALFAITIHNGCINSCCFEQHEIRKETDRIQQILKAYALDCVQVGASLWNHPENYVLKDGDQYKILNSIMFNFLCCYFCEHKDLQNLFLQLVDAKVFYGKLVLECTQKNFGEDFMSVRNLQEEHYFRRILGDISRKDYSVFYSRQMQVPAFRQKLIAQFTKMGGEWTSCMINTKELQESAITGRCQGPPLAIACSQGYEETVSFMLRHVEKSIKNKIVSALFRIAVGQGYPLSIVRLMIRSYANVNIVWDDSWTALSAACQRGNYEIANFLINAGSEINTVDASGTTPLMLACYTGLYETVQLLIKKRVDINTLNKSKMSALKYACIRGHENVVSLLLDNEAYTSTVYEDGRTPLVIAFEERHDRIISLLKNRGFEVDMKDTSGKTALAMACINGEIRTVQSLIKLGANINSRDNEGWVPLSRACKRGAENIVQVLLMENTLDINMTDDNGWTSLKIASFNGHNKVVENLLNAQKLEIDKADNNGWTPLMSSCQKGYIKVAELLICRNADVNHRCNDGITPLMTATQNKHIAVVNLLQEKKANTDIRVAYDN